MTAPGTYRYTYDNIVVTCMVCGDFKENAYLIRERSSGRTILLDPGDNLELIRSEITAAGSIVDEIILTHGHFDHVATAATLCREFGIPLKIHEKDTKLLRKASIYALSFTKCTIETPKDYLTFVDVAQFALNNLAVDVFPSPGHTAGGVCLHIDGVLFTGDSLFFQHIGPTDYPESNYQDLIDSVDRLLAHFADDTIIMPGHGRPWIIGEAKVWWAENRSAPPQFQIMHKRPTSNV